MNKSLTAIMFSLIFASLTLAPNIISIVDDNFDISILIDCNEEEEKKGEEKFKDFEIEVPSKSTIEYNSYTICLSQLQNANNNNYSSLFKELVSPPPELNI
jgi:hypothetical protein